MFDKDLKYKDGELYVDLYNNGKEFVPLTKDGLINRLAEKGRQLEKLKGTEEPLAISILEKRIKELEPYIDSTDISDGVYDELVELLSQIKDTN